MLDQSFSAENFRRILDYENRKGVFLGGEYFPKVKEIAEEIKKCNKDLKNKDLDKEKRKSLYEKKKELDENKNKQVDLDLEEVSKKVIDPKFRIELEQKIIPDQKPLYISAKLPEHYFSIKQVQRNISRLFNVKQSNRSEIIAQVKLLLGDKFPKFVIRTDVDDFYESIPHGLLYKLMNNNLLTPLSKKFIKQILVQYENFAGDKRGVPRGIGISAYLSELYMRQVDNKIRSLSEVSYYSRYVDDIIIIFTPKEVSSSVNNQYLSSVKKVFEEYSLNLNDEKTKEYDLINHGSRNHEMDYLGYRVKFSKGKVALELTDKKVEKYKNRMDLVFRDYINLSKVEEKKARRLLVKQIRFLTGNTRLANTKSNLLVGVYYSNSHLTELNGIKDLDTYLEENIKKNIASDSLKKRLSKYRFTEGFLEKRFSPFKNYELSKIIKTWNWM